MVDTDDLTVSVELDLDVGDAAQQAREIGDAWHDLANSLEEVADDE